MPICLRDSSTGRPQGCRRVEDGLGRREARPRCSCCLPMWLQARTTAPARRRDRLPGVRKTANPLSIPVSNSAANGPNPAQVSQFDRKIRCYGRLIGGRVSGCGPYSAAISRTFVSKSQTTDLSIVFAAEKGAFAAEQTAFTATGRFICATRLVTVQISAPSHDIRAYDGSSSSASRLSPATASEACPCHALADLDQHE